MDSLQFPSRQYFPPTFPTKENRGQRCQVVVCDKPRGASSLFTNWLASSAAAMVYASAVLSGHPSSQARVAQRQRAASPSSSAPSFAQRTPAAAARAPARRPWATPRLPPRASALLFFLQIFLQTLAIVSVVFHVSYKFFPNLHIYTIFLHGVFAEFYADVFCVFCDVCAFLFVPFLFLP